MEIKVNKYSYPKTVIGTQIIELDDKNNTYIRGRSGGSDYVACIIPFYYSILNEEYKQVGETLGSFIFISSTREREGRVSISLTTIEDEVWFKSALKNLPHGEDIVNYFYKEGEDYEHNICTEEYFNGQIKKWRII